MKFLEYGEDFLFDDMPKVYNVSTVSYYILLTLI